MSFGAGVGRQSWLAVSYFQLSHGVMAAQEPAPALLLDGTWGILHLPSQVRLYLVDKLELDGESLTRSDVFAPSAYHFRREDQRDLGETGADAAVMAAFVARWHANQGTDQFLGLGMDEDILLGF
ncbi:hypothetical protein EC957_009268 [Mortierella hygrophila]|uniref:Uncharacterized protein n=1 Tax=Mortierella hygrophila TaxID=979708 RepID=A0A9P6FID4_9FUNG|nr:hypothetical protein EC957_009268 [Mortierella hygrophila]